MPRQSITELREAIEAAPEMTPEHREEVLRLVDSLAEEVEGADESDAEKLRGAIALTKDVVETKGGERAPEDHDVGERLSELEERVEVLALEHPVVANVLTAISRLI